MTSEEEGQESLGSVDPRWPLPSRHSWSDEDGM